ncbi:MAG: nitroreductase [Ignavibacteria bacterium]|nr:nitroreductase [Ignavibacteria bacterium]
MIPAPPQLDKPPKTAAPIHSLLARRWSARAFADAPVEIEQIISLLEAARWSASSRNEQPWHFVVARKGIDSDFDRLLGSLSDSNRIWAQRAPLLILAVARTTFRSNGKPNRHAQYDVGQAVANLTTQATAIGLTVHQMGGFEGDTVRNLFAIPNEYDPLAVLAIGFRDHPDSLPTDLRDRELQTRQRLDLSSFVHSGTWNNPSALLHDHSSAQLREVNSQGARQ